MRRLLALTVLALLPLVAWGEAYICAAEMATGFIYRGGAWEQTPFKTDAKYIVRRPTQQELEVYGEIKYEWVVVEVGRPFPLMGCDSDFTKDGYLHCMGLGEFKMNRESLRFLHSYLFGYLNPDPGHENDATPLIAMGKCSPM